MTFPAEREELPPLRLVPSLLAVLVGGALGTLVRTQILMWTGPTYSGWIGYAPLSGHALPLSHPSWSDFVPWWLLVINTVGVFVATWLLAGPLINRSPDDPWRLALITGVLGGLTSYSSLIRDLAQIKSYSLLGAVVTLAGALTAGLVAAWVGFLASSRWRR